MPSWSLLRQTRAQVGCEDGARLGRRRLELPAEHEGEEVLLRRQQHEVVLHELQESKGNQ